MEINGNADNLDENVQKRQKSIAISCFFIKNTTNHTKSYEFSCFSSKTQQIIQKSFKIHENLKFLHKRFRNARENIKVRQTQRKVARQITFELCFVFLHLLSVFLI